MTLLRTPPKLKYNGLTLLLSHAGRFDKNKLIDGYYAKEVDSALAPIASRWACDIRTLECNEPLLPDTRVVLCCGAATLPKHFGEPASRLDQLRGSPTKIGDVVYIPTYHTTDAYDRQEYESRLNVTQQAALGNEADSERTSEDEVEDDHTTKNKGRTSRANYGFWLRQDLRKAIRIAKQGLREYTCDILLRKSFDDILLRMQQMRGQRIFFDIETLPGSNQISCFAVATDPTSVLSVSLISYSNQLCYGREGTRKILLALAALLNESEFVIHNAQFDLFILANYYRLCPPRRIADTMLMHARNYIGIEKSLGHCVSLYTDLPYHKDEGIFNPHNYTQETSLLTYNAKDVQTLALVYDGVRAHGAKLGALESQDQANSTLRAYLGMSLRGIKLDNDKLCAHLDSLTERSAWFETRVLPKLVGFNLNPRSPKQVAEYLYETLGLPKPKGGISPTGKTTLYRLAIAHQIPALKLILYLRRLSKDRGTMSFTQWKDGRATCCYKIAGTKFGRVSSSALLGVWGTNLQNLNKDRCREFFVSDSYE